MHIYKRSSLGTNKVKVRRSCDHRSYGAYVYTSEKYPHLLWAAASLDLRKLKRRMRRAGWIK